MLKIKRGQINNIFVYIFALVVIALILSLGYNYITRTKESITTTDLIILKNKLTSDVRSISSDFGSSKSVSYSLPLQTELCLIDLSNKNEILNNAGLDAYPLIKDSIGSDVNKNAFVVSDEIFETYYIGDIEIPDPYFTCLKPVAGKVSFFIEGAGNKALISINNQ